MLRIVLLLFVLIVLAGIGGFVYAGLRPPPPHVHSVDRRLNNDQFQTH